MEKHQKPLHLGDRVKPHNYAQPVEGYKDPVPVGWRLVSTSIEGRAVVQVTLIAYCSYEIEDLEYGGKG